MKRTIAPCPDTMSVATYESIPHHLRGPSLIGLHPDGTFISQKGPYVLFQVGRKYRIYNTMNKTVGDLQTAKQVRKYSKLLYRDIEQHKSQGAAADAA